MFPTKASNGRQRSTYRSKRAVRSTRDTNAKSSSSWSRTKILLFCFGALILAMSTILPVILLESSTAGTHSKNHQAPVSLHGLVQRSVEIEEEVKHKGEEFFEEAKETIKEQLHVNNPKPKELSQHAVRERRTPGKDKTGLVPKRGGNDNKNTRSRARSPAVPEKKTPVHKDVVREKPPLARGVVGLPMDKTPALIGAQPGHIECDVDVDDIVYWNDPQGTRDIEYVSPYKAAENSYLTFEPDQGGWNNVRMSMEIIFVLAAVTGRTLVLPPKAPFYLLGTGKENAKSFGRFFPFEHPAFKKKVDVITMSEFLEREKDGILQLSDSEYQKLKPIAELCLYAEGSPIHCDILSEVLRQRGMQPEIEAGHTNCLIFDLEVFKGNSPTEDVKKRVERFCGKERAPVYFDDTMHTPQLMHWNAGSMQYRLLNHFYAFLYFTDAQTDNYYKRFVRDFIHYKSNLFCAAGKIIHALNDEGKVWSSWHVRRGDLQYKEVKIPIDEWYNTTKEVWQKGEVLYIATDERNKTFFDFLRDKHELRFLDDYWDVARLGEIDSYDLGMIDTIISSHGRAFAGTWFSTFTGYINRMRGYLGHSMKNSWYGWSPRKNKMQEFEYINGNMCAREWPQGWVAIDGDEWIEHELGVSPVTTPGSKEEEKPPADDPSPVNPPKLENVVGKILDPHPIRKQQQLARGVVGLPMGKTPALEGAKPGTIDCDVDVDDIVYWNDPQGKRDIEYVSPYKAPESSYLTFEPDQGGWNNVRMSMEIIFVLAAATGRTLVLPPKSPFYLLGTGKENAKSFGRFFPFHHPAFKKKVKVITMSEFLEREKDGLLQLSVDEYQKVKPLADLCLRNPDSELYCVNLFSHLRKAGFQPESEALKTCLIFDLDVFKGNEPTEDVKKRAERFCGKERTPMYYDEKMHSPQLIHWNAGSMDYRLLNHFYAYLYFTDAQTDNYYKRFVRDFIHYKSNLFCAAGKIIHALNDEGKVWSSWHVRRGDLQYKEVKIPIDEWYNTTKEVWQKGEVLYIATDERNKTFFDFLRDKHELRFLDDYWDVARLGEIDPYDLGMIDTIISSHGRAFAGTWFSTFTGYINRMRGYLGHSMKNSWYGWSPRKNKMQEFEYINGNMCAREWPQGWVAIDGDEWIEHEGVPVNEPFVDNTPIVSTEAKDIKIEDLVVTDEEFVDKPLRRGLSGRDPKSTPALVGASRGHIDCDINIDSLAYWNAPQGDQDVNFVSPFRAEGEEKYISFTVDRGGWNNVRMSMEIIFVIAAATGRTLVLPPDEPLYRLSADQVNKYRGFADFFPLHTPEFAKQVKIISMAEFIEREGGPNGLATVPDAMLKNVTGSKIHCDKRQASPAFCGHITDYLSAVGFTPETRAQDGCVVFDEILYKGKLSTQDKYDSISRFCGTRKPFYFTEEIQKHPLLHFKAGDKEYRLLAHFYGYIHFTNPKIENHFKRFVRDLLRYKDPIYCAAGKIVKALQLEGKARKFKIDSDNGGGFSAMHIRRGEFQYQKVKIPAEEWYENTKEIWKPKELLYIATDERNKTFFDPIAKHHELRFLDDYHELAGLKDLDPNWFGMIDTIVASRSRAFAGTWFSTFTGYINRMRGYHGMTMNNTWYSYLERKTRAHTWDNVDSCVYAYEWPSGWMGIDSDTLPSKDVF